MLADYYNCDDPDFRFNYRYLGGSRNGSFDYLVIAKVHSAVFLRGRFSRSYGIRIDAAGSHASSKEGQVAIPYLGLFLGIWLSNWYRQRQ